MALAPFETIAAKEYSKGNWCFVYEHVHIHTSTKTQLAKLPKPKARGLGNSLF